MSTPFTVQEMLSFVPLTEAIKLVVSGVPKVLPEAFWSLRENVLGDKARHFQFRGNRKVGRVTPYGSPPRQRTQLPLETEDIKLLHAIEELPINVQQLLGVGQAFESYEAQVSFRDEMMRQMEEFAYYLANLEIASVTSMVANGYLWFDADGNILPTSSGATLTVDYGVPAGNTGSVGGIIVDWSNTASNIPTQVNNLKTYARQTTGYPLEWAFFGKNVAGYLANNTNFQAYLARNDAYRQQYINTGQVADGTLGLKWVPAQDAFFENDSGTVQAQFAVDSVTFTPGITRATYAMYEGSYRVPKSIQPIISGDLMDAINQTELVYGLFRFAQVTSVVPLQIKQTVGHTLLPKMKQPAAWFFVDTTP